VADFHPRPIPLTSTPVPEGASWARRERLASEGSAVLAPRAAAWPRLHLAVPCTTPILGTNCWLLLYAGSPSLPSVLQVVVVGKEEGVFLF